MASVYSRILKEKKEEQEKYSVLRRPCPYCKRLMHRLEWDWWCGHCYKKFNSEGKEYNRKH